MICHFCSETGHMSTKNEGQEVIQYYGCSIMSPEKPHNMNESYVLVTGGEIRC